MISKQDRVKARSVEDLERKYNFKQMGGNSSDSLTSATEAREAASEAKEAARRAESSVANKVGRDEYNEIVRMLNNSTDTVFPKSDKVVVESKNFTITEDEEGTQQVIELMRFQPARSVVPYRLCLLMALSLDDPLYPDGKWVLVDQFIEPVEEQE